MPFNATVRDAFLWSDLPDYDANASHVDPLEHVKDIVFRELKDHNINATADMFTYEPQCETAPTYVRNRLEQHLIYQLQKILYYLNSTHDDATLTNGTKTDGNSSAMHSVKTAMLSEVALLIVHLCQHVDASRRVFAEDVSYIHALLMLLLFITVFAGVLNFRNRWNASKDKVVLLEPPTSDQTCRENVLTETSRGVYFKHSEENGVHTFRPTSLNEVLEDSPQREANVWMLNRHADKFVKWRVYAKVQGESVDYYSYQRSGEINSSVGGLNGIHLAGGICEGGQTDESKTVVTPEHSSGTSNNKRNQSTPRNSPVRSPATPLRARRRSEVHKVNQSGVKKSPIQSGMVLRNGKETPRRTLYSRNRDDST